MVLSGFCKETSFTPGVFEGIQKLGSILSLPFFILETESPSVVLELLDTMVFSPFRKFCSFFSSSLAVCSCDCSYNEYSDVNILIIQTS